MAAGMAHELRNPLAAISGSVQYLKGSVKPQGETLDLMDIILRESQRLDQTIKDFLTFARPGRFAPQRVDLVRLVEDHLKLLRNAVEHFRGGLLFFHFFGVDQDSHMLWGKYEDDLLKTYQMVDEALGWVRQQAPDAELMVMSDHGFSSFDRAVHLNTWLMKEGFLVLDDPKNVGDEELFAHVDWSRTKAYSVGLNAIYLNLAGREREGSVTPGVEADALVNEIGAKLLGARDPQTGEPMIGGVTVSRTAFRGDSLEKAPEIIVGYMPRYRSSWQTALGAVPAQLVDDNTEAWRGDHCIDARFVPGVLICNRASREPKPRLMDLTVSLMNRFNVGPGQGMSGHSIY